MPLPIHRSFDVSNLGVWLPDEWRFVIPDDINICSVCKSSQCASFRGADCPELLRLMKEEEEKQQAAVIYRDRGSKYLVIPYDPTNPIPKQYEGFEVTKVFTGKDCFQWAEEYKNECLADQYMQQQEQKAADSCWEE